MSGKRWLIWRRLRRLYAGFRHPDTPWWAKGLVILILLYGISPVDLIPDLVPFVGWLDDVSLLLLLLWGWESCLQRSGRGWIPWNEGRSDTADCRLQGIGVDSTPFTSWV